MVGIEGGGEIRPKAVPGRLPRVVIQVIHSYLIYSIACMINTKLYYDKSNVIG